ncbi:hypothetical protein F3Y22_tig00111614pilonHSYRG00115 [Hibiscus syriacus]|uniref:Uncharacterized protein n=1 Tax=Hibiscus syriacus TaxID=106335 RepID=A0A6A2YJG5_HIBSY|nr:hypothetical protein F3Y22_tig00111614pilonHSYRG00115 [Hibiscus syriacus]
MGWESYYRRLLGFVLRVSPYWCACVCMVLGNLHILVIGVIGWESYYRRLLGFVLRITAYRKLADLASGEINYLFCSSSIKVRDEIRGWSIRSVPMILLQVPVRELEEF